MKKRLEFLDVEYEFSVVEGEGDMGSVVESYIHQLKETTRVDLVVVGTRNNGSLKRWVLGSVSEHLIHNLDVPLTVVKTCKDA